MTRRTRWIALVALTLALLAPTALLQALPTDTPTSGATGGGATVVPAGPNAEKPATGDVHKDAKAATQPDGNKADPNGGQSPFSSPLLIGMVALIAVMFFMQSRGRKKQTYFHYCLLCVYR